VLRQDRNSCVRPELKLLFDAENVARTSNAALRARKSVAPGQVSMSPELLIR